MDRRPQVRLPLRRRKKSKANSQPLQPSESGESSGASASGDSQDARTEHAKAAKSAGWETLSGLQEGQRYEYSTNKFEGLLSKRRKWPMKGWHKRFFQLDEGVLTYGKNVSEVLRGKRHGALELGSAVISTKMLRRRIHVDSENSIVHLKCKCEETYLQWVEQLKQHQLRAQHLSWYDKRPARSPLDTADDSPNGGTLRPRSSEDAAIAADLLTARQTLAKLSAAAPEPPNTTKGRRKFRLRKFLRDGHSKAENKPGTLDSSASIDRPAHCPAVNQSSTGSQVATQLTVPVSHRFSAQSDTHERLAYLTKDTNNLCDLRQLSCSNPTLSSLPPDPPSPSPSPAPPAVPPSPAPLEESFTEVPSEHFAALANDLLLQLTEIHRRLQQERQRLPADGDAVALRARLAQAHQQNTELRCRLARVHCDSDLSTLASPGATLTHALRTRVSRDDSSCFSASEYFDAASANSDSSSDRSGATSASEASDATTDVLTTSSPTPHQLDQCFTGRRTTLAATIADKTDFSVFNFLYKNIGKDLSRVSMPISMNEPLNLLQRMCEELEYSELLDKAATLREPAQRMVQVAAFAISSYVSATHRAAHKPFNPLLGETYECVREDKGFKFVAEQVSHHPPVSACHVTGNNFTLWQDVRVKTKFWGKSLELQPSGSVHLKLRDLPDTYEWNKVTSCVHNLFGGGERWLDQYGEMRVTNATHGLTCKVTFVKASSWSGARHDVYGSVVDDATGDVLHKIFGKWSEAIYCGHAPSARLVWRPGAMPERADLYYGFTRFAIELNELIPAQRGSLPPTDTRLRPDQRLLEEGRLAEAEPMKQELEAAQRERRRLAEVDGTPHLPMWFRREEGDGGGERWTFNGQYWRKKLEPGFANMSLEALW